MNKSPANFVFVSALTIVVAFCSIVYELIYSQALTVLYGETVARYSITIGLYLLSLGLGAFFYNQILPKGNALFFWWNELLLSVIGPAGVLFLFVLSEASVTSGLPPRGLALFISHIPVIAVGVLSGFELPLLVGLLDEGEKNKFSKVLGLDYVGSFIGTIVYSLWLYPSFGLITAAIGVGFLNAAALLIYSFRNTAKEAVLKWVSVIFFILYLLLLFLSDGLQDSIVKSYRESQFRPIFEKTAEVRQTSVADIEMLEVLRTPYQEATIYTVSYANGEKDTCLSLDANLQLCESWLGDYHEGLVDVPMRFLGGRPVKVLLVGGGDWIAARYLLKYPNVELIDHVDIDRKFSDHMKTEPHFKRFHGDAFNDPRVHTVIDDAYNWLRFNRKSYDLILVDIPGITHDKLAHLYSTEFYTFMADGLVPDGLVVFWDYLATGKLRPHYETFMNTLRDAGFRYHVVYNTLDFSRAAHRSSQPFYIVSRERALLPGPSEAADRIGQLSWMDIPSFPGVRPNTVIRPNYEIVIHK